MPISDDDEKLLDPLEAVLSDPGPLPPMGPDGAFRPSALPFDPMPIPAAVPEQFVCLRGPCRHYWEHVALMGVGNTPDTLNDEPAKQIVRLCTYLPGIEYNLTDSNVFECTRWDPEQEADVQTLNNRREAYYQINPHLRPKKKDENGAA